MYREWLSEVVDTINKKVVIEVISTSALVVLGDENSREIAHLQLLSKQLYILYPLNSSINIFY